MEVWRKELQKKFPIDKPKTSEEHLKYAMNQLEESMFRFCCFVDMFNTYWEKHLNEKNN